MVYFEGSIDFLYYCLNLCFHCKALLLCELFLVIFMRLTDKYSLFSFFETETTASHFRILTLFNHIVSNKTCDSKAAA